MKKKVSLQDRVKRESESSAQFKQGFRMEAMEIATLASPAKNALSVEQSNKIEDLFKEYRKETATLEEVNNDLHETLELSSSVKNITEQSTLLVGERILKAQSVMANYKNGMFNKWLLLVFGNKVTPYNILNYYNLHQAIRDSSLKGLLEKLPKRAAYKLASRKGDLEHKLELLNDCVKLEKEGKNAPIKAAQLEKIINNKIPLSADDRRSAGVKIGKGDMKEKLSSYLSSIVKIQKFIDPNQFTDQEVEMIEDVIYILKKWLSK